jgi:hypothetical protein
LAEYAEYEGVEAEDPDINYEPEDPVREIRSDPIGGLIALHVRLPSKAIKTETFPVNLTGESGPEGGTGAAGEHPTQNRVTVPITICDRFAV